MKRLLSAGRRMKGESLQDAVRRIAKERNLAQVEAAMERARDNIAKAQSSGRTADVDYWESRLEALVGEKRKLTNPNPEASSEVAP